nr:putative replication-like polyprotein [Ailanthus crinkle leaf associated bluner-like virus]
MEKHGLCSSVPDVVASVATTSADFAFIKTKLGEAFGSSSVEELQRGMLLNSAAHTASLESSIVNGVQHSLTLEKKKPVLETRWVASSDSVERLASTFTNYNVVPGVSRDAPFHAFAREHRRCEFLYIRDVIVGGSDPVQLGISPWGKKYDVRWKDVGGNLRHHMQEGVRQSHCCAPITNNADVKRSNDTLLYVCAKAAPMRSRGGVRGGHMDDYLSAEPLYSCNNLGQYCDVAAPVLSMIHACYDVTLDDLALILERSHCVRAVFSFIFHPDIIAKQSGRLPELGCDYNKFKRHNKNMISFTFDSDPQSAYIHEFDTYASMLTSSFVETPSGRRYVLETIFFKNSVVMIEANAVICGNLPKQYVMRKLPFVEDFQRFVTLYTWEYNTVAMNGEHLKPIRLVCPKPLFDGTLAYVCSLPTGKFTYQNTYQVLLSFNTREIVGGVQVGVHNKLDPESAGKVATAIYIIAYILNYENFQVVEMITGDEKEVRAISGGSWFHKVKSRIRSFFNGSYYKTAVGSGDIRHPLVRPDVIEIGRLPDRESKCSVLESFLNFGERARHYPIEYDIGPRVLSMDDEVPSYCNTLPKYALPYVAFPSSKDVIESSRVVRAALSDTFVDSNVVVHLPREVISASCDVSDREVVDVPADGDCLYHAFSQSLDIDDDPVVIRSRCLSSAYLASFDDTTASDLKGQLSASGVAGWGNNDTIKLLSAEYDVSVCLHTDGHFTVYNGGCVKKVHLVYSKNHFQFIRSSCAVNLGDIMDVILDEYDDVSDVITSYRDVGASIVTQPFDLVGGKRQYKNAYTVAKKYSEASRKCHRFRNSNKHGYSSFYGPSLFCAVRGFPSDWRNTRVLDINQNNGSSAQMFADGLGANVCVLSQSNDILSTMRKVERRLIRSINDKRLAVSSVVAADEFDVISFNPSQYSDNVGYIDITRHDSYLHNVIPALRGLKIHGSVILAVPVFLTPLSTRLTDVLYPYFSRVYISRDNVSPKFNPWVFVVFMDLLDKNALTAAESLDSNRSYSARVVDMFSVLLASAKAEVQSSIDAVREFVVKGITEPVCSDGSLRDISTSIPTRRCSITGGGVFDTFFYSCSDEMPQLNAVFATKVCRENGVFYSTVVGHSIVVKKFQESYTSTFLSIMSKTFGPEYGKMSAYMNNQEKIFARHGKTPLAKFLKCAMKYVRINALLGSPVIRLNIPRDAKLPVRISLTHMSSALSSLDNKLAEDKYNAMLLYKGGVNCSTANAQVNSCVLSAVSSLNKDGALMTDNESSSSDSDQCSDDDDKLSDHDFSDPDTNIIAKTFPKVPTSGWSYVFDCVKADRLKGCNAILSEALHYFSTISDNVEQESLRCKNIITALGSTDAREYRESRLAGFEDLCYKFDNKIRGNKSSMTNNFFLVWVRDSVDVKYKPTSDVLEDPAVNWLTYKELSVLTERRLVDQHKNHRMSVPFSDGVGFVQAPPGCGKTTSIIKLYFELRGITDTYICVSSRDAKHDVLARLEDYASNNDLDFDRSEATGHLFSIDSYLLNESRVSPCETLLVDEAFMQHAGKLYLLLSLSKCKYAKFFGDALQIPFVNRCPNFTMLYAETFKALPFSDVHGHTYRCPVDVCVRLSPYYQNFNLKLGYNYGLTSHNSTAPSVEVKRITSIDEVPLVPNATYLSFKQDEKEQLIRKFGAAKTVHEFQGQQNGVIVLVRTSRAESDVIYTRLEYIIVAISRHTQKLIYYTASSSSDPVAEMFAERLHLADKRCQSHLALKLDVVGGGTVLEPEKQLTVFRPPIREYAGAAVVNTTKTVPFVSNGGLRITMTGAGFNKHRMDVYRNNHTLRLSPEVASSSRKIGDLLEFYKKSITARNVIVDNNVTKFTSPATLCKWIYAHDPAKFVISRGNDESFVSDSVTTNIIMNAMPVLPNTKPVFLNRLVINDDTSSPFCVSDVKNHVEVLSDFVRAVRPRSMYVPTAHDVDLFHLSDYRVQTGKLRYNRIMVPYFPVRFDRMRPVLSTGCPHELRVTPRHVVYAASKRNMIPANERSVVDLNREITKMVGRLLSACDRSLDFTGIDVTPSDMQAWADDQPEKVQNRLEPQAPVHMLPLNAYKFTLKSTAKTDLDSDLLNTYPCPQTILHQDKDINAIFCTIWGEIRDRVLASLKNKVIVYTGMDDSSFGEKLTSVIRPSSAKLYTALEFDMKKYDKSQHELILEFECELLRRFGVSPLLVSCWRNAHAVCVVTDNKTKIVFKTVFQRKSGDASTFFGNTIALLVMLLDVIPIEKIACICVAGDDSLVFTTLNPCNLNMSIISQKYNLDCKLFLFRHHYFCSKFIVPYKDSWAVVPDPVKRVVKLGRTDLRNREHVEKYRISYADNVAIYSNMQVATVTSAAIQERYRITYDSTWAIITMADVARPEPFHSLWYSLSGDVLCMDSSLPETEL